MERSALERYNRAYNTDKGGATPVEVVSFDLSGEPTVTVRPLVKTRVRDLGGETQDLDPLEIREVPYYVYSSNKFAMFIPPEIGQQGLLVNTNVEIGEVKDGINDSQRIYDRSSGVFMPTGRIGQGSSFAGNEGWAELRSGNSRIAIAEEGIHLQSGGTYVAITETGFDFGSGGNELIAAIKELSSHLADVENRLRRCCGGSGARSRIADKLNSQVAPTRSESGVRA